MAEKQDIAMNQFTQVTDVAYVYGEKSNNQNKIAVEDLVKQMGIYTYSFTLAANEEKDLGSLGYGLYIIASSEIGGSAIYISGSYPDSFISDAGIDSFCDYTDGSKAIVFGRKKINGSFFIKNNRNEERNIRIKKISI